jgi:hypothetical protein
MNGQWWNDGDGDESTNEPSPRLPPSKTTGGPVGAQDTSTLGDPDFGPEGQPPAQGVTVPLILGLAAAAVVLIGFFISNRDTDPVTTLPTPANPTVVSAETTVAASVVSATGSPTTIPAPVTSIRTTSAPWTPRQWVDNTCGGFSGAWGAQLPGWTIFDADPDTYAGFAEGNERIAAALSDEADLTGIEDVPQLFLDLAAVFRSGAIPDEALLDRVFSRLREVEAEECITVVSAGYTGW